MQSNIISPLLVALIFVMYCLVAIAAPLGTVVGRVTDSEGAAITGAHLLFHVDRSGRAQSSTTTDLVSKTDSMGQFVVHLQPGFYDFCIMATAFSPECDKILVSKEGDVHHEVHLKADPLVIKHLGDKF